MQGRTGTARHGVTRKKKKKKHKKDYSYSKSEVEPVEPVLKNIYQNNASPIIEKT